VINNVAYYRSPSVIFITLVTGPLHPAGRPSVRFPIRARETLRLRSVVPDKRCHQSHRTRTRVPSCSIQETI